MDHYHIYPSFHPQDGQLVRNILRHLVESLPNQVKIWRFESTQFNGSVDKKTRIDNLKAFQNSKMLLSFLTKHYLEHESFEYDLVLAETSKKQIVILVIDEFPEETLNKLRDYNTEVSVLNVAKELAFFESGCFRLFIKFVEDTDRSLEFYRYNSPNSLYSCVPVYHYKCRYDSNDKNCGNHFYTRTNNVVRFNVPIAKINWNTNYLLYKPTNFTSDKVKDRKAGNYKDPDVDSEEYRTIKFNNIDNKANCDRRSHHGDYKLKLNGQLNALVPLNPVGRTGLVGRGHLGRWGVNHAADPVVTRWKRNERNEVIRDPVTHKPILQFVSIQRKDTKLMAIPGGMRDPNEIIHNTLIREFAEEALNSQEFEFSQKSGLVAKSSLEENLKQFFSHGVQIYKGYVDDPRNTDNAWMETVVYNFHDENDSFVGSLKLESGSDAEKVQWVDLSSSLQLFASHADFIYEVAVYRHAHW